MKKVFLVGGLIAASFVYLGLRTQPPGAPPAPPPTGLTSFMKQGSWNMPRAKAAPAPVPVTADAQKATTLFQDILKQHAGTACIGSTLELLATLLRTADPRSVSEVKLPARAIDRESCIKFSEGAPLGAIRETAGALRMTIADWILSSAADLMQSVPDALSSDVVLYASTSANAQPFMDEYGVAESIGDPETLKFALGQMLAGVPVAIDVPDDAEEGTTERVTLKELLNNHLSGLTLASSMLGSTSRALNAMWEKQTIGEQEDVLLASLTTANREAYRTLQDARAAIEQVPVAVAGREEKVGLKAALTQLQAQEPRDIATESRINQTSLNEALAPINTRMTELNERITQAQTQRTQATGLERDRSNKAIEGAQFKRKKLENVRTLLQEFMSTGVQTVQTALAQVASRESALVLRLPQTTKDSLAALRKKRGQINLVLGFYPWAPYVRTTARRWLARGLADLARRTIDLAGEFKTALAQNGLLESQFADLDTEALKKELPTFPRR